MYVCILKKPLSFCVKAMGTLTYIAQIFTFFNEKFFAPNFLK